MNDTFYRNLDSCYIAELIDGSILSEPTTPWSSISEEVAVMWGGKTKVALICTKPIKKLTIRYDGLEASMELNEGEQVYQAIKSCAKWNEDGSSSNDIIGRIIGRVKDGKVIEEQFINSLQKTIQGVKF